jgi:polyisoprenoid-binding protein YceI
MATATKLSGTYTADPVHSSFAFSVRYQGVSLFKGSLDEVDAKLVDGALEGAAKVESISIRTPEQFRAHVLSAEFFDAENHPTVDFRSGDVEIADDGTAKDEGELTIKGITRPVTATGTWIAPEGDAFGNTRGHLNL